MQKHVVLVAPLDVYHVQGAVVILVIQSVEVGVHLDALLLARAHALGHVIIPVLEDVRLRVAAVASTHADLYRTNLIIIKGRNPNRQRKGCRENE